MYARIYRAPYYYMQKFNFLHTVVIPAYNVCRGIIMKISVCLIVKNEESVIGRCLKSVILFADEIIVVDTGSGDKTKEIASKFTDKIYDLKWNDDFSAARNYAFSKASCNYLFWIDADDVISEENARKIIEIKNNEPCFDTYMFRYAVAFDKNGNATFEYYRERLMKNCSLAKFSGFIHEAVVPFGRITYGDVTVEHRKIKSGDPLRNLKIYEKHLAEGEKLNGREQYYYSKELFYNGRYDKAKTGLIKFIYGKTRYLPDVKDAYKTVYKCDKSLGIITDEKFLAEAIAVTGADAELFCYLGDVKTKKRDTKNASAFYKCALCADKPLPQDGFYEAKFYYLEPLLRLVSAYYNAGDIETAEKYHEICLEKYPSSEEVTYNSKFFRR